MNELHSSHTSWTQSTESRICGAHVTLSFCPSFVLCWDSPACSYSTKILTTSSASSSIHEGKARVSGAARATFLSQLPMLRPCNWFFFNSFPHVQTIPLGLLYLSALVPIAHVSALKLISIHPTPCVARYLMHIRPRELSSTCCNVTGAVCFCPFEPSRLLSHSVVCQNKSTEPLWASRDKTALSLQRRLEATQVRSNETEEIRMLSSVYV